MRRIHCIAVLMGCAGGLSSASLDASKTSMTAATITDREEAERKADEQRIEEHVKQSAARLDGGDPHCPVRITRSGPRKWSIWSCEIEVKCWELTVREAYECER